MVKDKLSVELSKAMVNCSTRLFNFSTGTDKLITSNAGLRIEEVESMLEARIDNSRFQLSVYDFLDIVLDLNIIVNDNGKYSFIHELYQEYY